LLCKGKKTDSCLSKEQLAAVKVVYDGPKDSKGNSLYYGYPFGGENSEGGWPRWLTGGLKYQADLDDFRVVWMLANSRHLSPPTPISVLVTGS